MTFESNNKPGTRSGMLSDRYSRREFLARAGRYSSLSLMALFFGCDVAQITRDEHERTALVYATKYGATKETAGWIRNGLAFPVDLVDIEQVSFADLLDGYDRFIVGSGVWTGGVHKRVLEFLETGSERLNGKVTATFIVCGTDGSKESGKKRIDGYFRTLHTSLETKPALSRSFGGRVIVEQLTEEDREALTRFYRMYLHRELKSWDRTEPSTAEYFGAELKKVLEKNVCAFS